MKTETRIRQVVAVSSVSALIDRGFTESLAHTSPKSPLVRFAGTSKFFVAQLLKQVQRNSAETPLGHPVDARLNVPKISTEL